MSLTPVRSQRASATPTPTPPPTARTPSKPSLNMSDSVNPSQWLNFSLPPRQRNVPGSGAPRRSKKGEGWRSTLMSRERFVQANFRFVLKPTEMLSYGAHFADPDISLHWPNILQILVPTFSAFSVAQGYVHSHADHVDATEDDLARSFDEAELDAMPDEAAERRRRMEEERRGRMCPICLGKPVAGRMTKCGHIFCFPCILHYIQLSEIPKSARCPICGDTVHEGMLKSVKYLDSGAMLSAMDGEDDAQTDADSHRAGDSSRTSSPLHQAQDHGHDHGMSIVGEMDGFDELDHRDAPIVIEGQDISDPDAEVNSRHRIHMRSVQRPQMTTLALPTSATWPSEAVPPHTAPWYFLPDVLSYSRFMLATPDYMMSELHREHDELKAEWDLLRGDELGRDFVKAAKEKVERQMGKVRAELMTAFVKKTEIQNRDAWADVVGGERLERERKKERDRRAREREEAANREVYTDFDPSTIPSEMLATQITTFAPSTPVIPPNIEVEPNPMPSVAPRKARRRAQPSSPAPAPVPPGHSYYFYQSSLGANVFLHPLDIRILLAHFKSYSLFPHTISFTSSGFDPGTINDELRKRCKYLGHLPVGTEVVFVEAELEEIVGKEGLAAFEQPLRARREKRRARTRKEDRAKSRWEQAERDKMPKTPLSQPKGEDDDFTAALIRSALDAAAEGSGTESNWTTDHALGTSPASSSQLRPSPGSSPSVAALTWGANQQRSFASTLTAAATAPPPPRRTERTEGDWEVDAVWDAFDRMDVSEAGSVRVTESGGGNEGGRGGGGGGGGGGGKKGNKKSKKTLVLGGAGRGAR